MKVTRQEIKGNVQAGNFNYHEQDNDLGRLLTAMYSMGNEEDMTYRMNSIQGLLKKNRRIRKRR